MASLARWVSMLVTMLIAACAPRRQRAGLLRAVDPNMYIPEGVQFHSWLGFLGGTVGVVGTLLTYEKARFKVPRTRGSQGPTAWEGMHTHTHAPQAHSLPRGLTGY